MKNIKWRAILGLSLVYISIFFELYWVFGIFFLIWAISDVVSRTTYVFGPINRDENPFLFWFTIFTWTGLAMIYFFMFK